MSSPVWSLPTVVRVSGREYPVNADYRDILDIITRLDDPDTPAFERAPLALALFYVEQPPAELAEEALAAMFRFINVGEEPKQGGPRPPKRFDWELDAAVIVADINQVAGCEVRAMPFLHWWTFVAYFNAIGRGQLSTIVAIRDKQRKGRKLEKWESEFLAENRDRVVLKKKYTAEERAEMDAVNAMLNGER